VREVFAWLRGAHTGSRVSVPLRFVTGMKDPVLTPALHDEQAHDLVLERIRTLLSAR
jgi:hypothetical protein